MLSLALSLLPLVFLPPAAIAQTTALVIQSEAGDPVGSGLAQRLAPPEATFVAVRNYQNGISVTVEIPQQLWKLEFSLPDAAALTPGHYSGATRLPFTSFTGLSVTGHSGCNELTGRYLVREVAYGPSGDVLRFAVDVEQHCNNITPALFAALRFNSTIDEDIFPGTAARYSLTFSPPVGGSVSGGGLACGAGEAVCATTFTSATTVTLVPAPLEGYVFNGWTGGCGGADPATVTVNTVKECGALFEPAIATAARTRVEVTSSPGEYIGQGKGWSYSLPNSRWAVTTHDAGDDLSFSLNTVGTTGGDTWTFRFVSPANTPLQEGYYPDAVRASYRMTVPGLYIGTAERGCMNTAGEFTVHEYRRDPITGVVIAFAADFIQRCLPLSAPLAGRIEYRATYQLPGNCAAPDPFIAIGGGTCYTGGWLPSGTAPPPNPLGPPPSMPSTVSCSTPDPFVAIGGGVCHNGGWLPRGMTPPGQAGCATTDPFAAMGGGTCVNGGWLPPGMSRPGGVPPASPPPITPPVSIGTCTTPDPFATMGGGTCHAGGWLPPGMPIPGGGGWQP